MLHVLHTNRVRIREYFFSIIEHLLWLHYSKYKIYRIGLWVLNVTFNNISFIYRSVLYCWKKHLDLWENKKFTTLVTIDIYYQVDVIPTTIRSRPRHAEEKNRQ